MTSFQVLGAEFISENQGIYANTNDRDRTRNPYFSNGEALNDDTPLLGNVIDSQGVIELIMFVQERFAITVDDEEVTTDNFASVNSTVAFIENKLRGKG
jgi:acyl carrier protein